MKNLLARLNGWKIKLLNGSAALAQTVLLILGYLETVDVSSVMTVKQALLWSVGIQLATIVLRQWFTTPATAETA